MNRRQRLFVGLLVLVNAILLVIVARQLVRWMTELPSAATVAPTRTPVTREQAIPLPPTWTHTPTRQPRPTETPGPTSTPTKTPLPIPTWSPGSGSVAGASSPRQSSGPYFAPTLGPNWEPATLPDFWAGRARWVIETVDTGLPPEGSDTVQWGGEFWSYAHAGQATQGIKDQCGNSVPLPGCVTLWKSFDGGRHFSVERPVCLFPCVSCPCSEVDHVEQQQYPRVFFDETGGTMVYEWGAATFLRTSKDGVNWSGEARLPGTGIWYDTQQSCTPSERIGEHPHTQPVYDCLAGAPPGLYVEGDRLYVFVGLGRAPGHMGCLTGDKRAGVAGLRPCAANPLFRGAASYGPVEDTGHAANAYFDFRTVSSADVIRVGTTYYMAYEGTRGPSDRFVREDQFTLAFARSVGSAIDGPWEKYPGNPVLVDIGDNWGIGHADIVEANGITYMYTTTSRGTRGRYVLVEH